jgi:hypothetical protein
LLRETVELQKSVVKFFIAYSHRRCLTCFGHHYAHHQELSQTAVAASGFRLIAEVNVFPAVVGLLVRISNKRILQLIVASGWVLYFII